MYIHRLEGNKFDDPTMGQRLADSVSKMKALRTLRYDENV